VADPYVYRTYLAPERDPGDQKTAAALSILAELLGGDGQTSVLARALQFDSQIAVYSAAFYDGTSLDDAPSASMWCPAPGVTLPQAEAALDAVLADFLAKGPDAADFERIKTQIRAGEIYARDDVEGLARMYGEELSHRPVDCRYRRLRRHSRRRHAGRRQDRRRPVLDRKSRRYRLADPSRRGSAHAGRHHRPSRRSRRGVHRMSFLARFPAAFALILLALPAWAQVKIQEVKTPGGLTAWLSEGHDLPFVALEIYFAGGTRWMRRARRGAVNLMTGLLEEGADDMDSLGFAEARDSLAAHFSFDSGTDTVSVSARFLTENRDAAVDLLAAALARPRFRPGRASTGCANRCCRACAPTKPMPATSRRAFDTMTFGDHPYATDGDGTLASVAGLTRDDMIAAHAATLARDRVIIAPRATSRPRILRCFSTGCLAACPPPARRCRACALEPDRRRHRDRLPLAAIGDPVRRARHLAATTPISSRPSS
jgi:predicted Zn-dependent peptidase